MIEPGTPCNQCGTADRYYRGTFSYCRFCHKEAQKRYLANLSNKDVVVLPKRDLEYLMSSNGRKGHHERNKLACPQGHPYDNANTRKGTQKKGKNLVRQCRICNRNVKRASYGLDLDPSYTKLSDMLDN